MDKYKYVVVGSGFFGTTIAERIANDLNEKVLVLEKRNHIGGNCYSEFCNQTGIEYHKYGSHIFHTPNKKVWDYINKFGSFNNYFHQVLTVYKNRVFQMPINLETINTFYGVNLRPFEVTDFINKERAKENYLNPKNLEEQAINFIGRPLYEAFIKGYTEKQWGRKATELSADIIKRLPFRTSYYENYFFDKYQGIPIEGYTSIFKNMLKSDCIDIKLNTDFFDVKDRLSSNAKIIYSGPIDRYFNFKYGKLDWLSVQFEHEVHEYEDYQGTTVVNYAESNVPYTRIHEPKHFHLERSEYFKMKKTLTIKEFPVHKNIEEPYYPINNDRNNMLYKKYRKDSKREDKVIFGGRLGDYKYYDMHHVIQEALNVYENKIAKPRKNES